MEDGRLSELPMVRWFGAAIAGFHFSWLLGFLMNWNSTSNAEHPTSSDGNRQGAKAQRTDRDIRKPGMQESNSWFLGFLMNWNSTFNARQGSCIR